MKNVLLLESIPPLALEVLRAAGHHVLPSSTPESGPEIAREHPVHAIITRGKGRVDAALIAACPQLKVIARCGVGLDNVDQLAASVRKIPVVNTPGANAATVAEHTLMLMLALSRDLFPMVAAVKRDEWAARADFAGDEVRRKTLGIVGLGNIGSRVKKLAEAFGMKVIHTTRQGGKPDLHALLGAADIVSLHLPYTAQNHHLIGKAELDHMKGGALLINTSRAGLIDQAALSVALNQGTLRGFAADLFDAPDNHQELLSRPNVLVTPHVASLTDATYVGMCLTSVENVAAILAGHSINAHYIANRGMM